MSSPFLLSISLFICRQVTKSDPQWYEYAICLPACAGVMEGRSQGLFGYFRLKTCKLPPFCARICTFDVIVSAAVVGWSPSLANTNYLQLMKRAYRCDKVLIAIGV
jgi:predicted ABC-type sugar transport system permease subunit